MKKLIVTCALLSATMLSFAQNAATTSQQKVNTPDRTVAPAPINHAQPEQVAQRRSMVYQKQLGLSDDQTKGVYSAELDYAKQTQSLRAAGAQPTDGAYQQAGMVRDQRIQNVLTPDQAMKFQSMKAKTGNQQMSSPQPNTSTPAHKN